MTHTIEELWRGNITPFDRCGTHDPDINELVVLMERNKACLCKDLTPVQQDTFEKYAGCWDEYLLRMTEMAFCEGFRLAGRLTAESLLG